MFSPDGSRIAFMSQRDGNSEIYVMNRDGSGVRRLTNNTRSRLDADVVAHAERKSRSRPDRSGSPQIWVMDTEGLNLRRITVGESWADRATWSPAPFNEIAYAARTGPGFDIRIYDVGDRPDQDDHRRRGHQREPGVLAQRPAHRVLLVAARQDADLHDGARRQGPAADHADGQQHVPELVELNGAAGSAPTMDMMDMVATTLMRLRSLLCICLVLLMGAAACHKSQPPVARPTPPAPPPPPATATRPPEPPAPVREPMPPQPLPSDDVSAPVARRFEPRLTAAAGLFRLRQLGRQRRQPHDRCRPTPRC